MAEVKLDPNWSLYALHELNQDVGNDSATMRIFRSLLVCNVDHPLRVGIAEVTRMRKTKMNLVLVERVFDFVWVDTCRQTRDNLLGTLDVCSVQDVVVDLHVVAEEGRLKL